MDAQAHWQQVYGTKRESEVSWYQREPTVSLDLIRSTLRDPNAGRVIDVGGGASLLVDRLLDLGVGHVAVLDVADAALDKARTRLGVRAASARWIVGDVTHVGDVGQFDLWHDRAVFHFLIEGEDRRRYAELAARTLPPGGTAIIATFAPDGPERCSGLPVRRYAAGEIAQELGPRFALDRAVNETHTTPGGKPQSFVYAVLRRV